MLHPDGRVSDVQRRQMTTVRAHNVHNIAIDGSFDDAQALVKRMFNDSDFAGRFSLSAVNSINWARLMAQVVYYFYAAVRLGGPDRSVRSEEHTSELQSLMRISYAVFCLKKKITRNNQTNHKQSNIHN